MKTLKIVAAILVLALVAVGATVATAFAFGWGAQTPYGPRASGRKYVVTEHHKFSRL